MAVTRKKKPETVKLPNETGSPLSASQNCSGAQSTKSKSCEINNSPKLPGKRGRPRGQGRLRQASAKAIFLAAQGESPLEYMLRVMRQADDDLKELVKRGKITEADYERLITERDERRDWAAQAAAPYVHPKLASVDMKVDDSREKKLAEAKVIDALTDQELEALETILLQGQRRANGQPGRTH